MTANSDVAEIACRTVVLHIWDGPMGTNFGFSEPFLFNYWSDWVYTGWSFYVFTDSPANFSTHNDSIFFELGSHQANVFRIFLPELTFQIKFVFPPKRAIFRFWKVAHLKYIRSQLSKHNNFLLRRDINIILSALNCLQYCQHIMATNIPKLRNIFFKI